MQSVTYQKDAAGIAHLVFDKPGANANLMDKAFAEDYARCVASALEDDCVGVILRSNKSTFFSGGDLAMLAAVNQDNADELFVMLEQIKSSMRALETCGKPVVACLNGAAMGGGWELALACHHRIALDAKSVRLGLPEVTLGLLPGGGGVTRMVRLLGLEQAIPYLTQGKQVGAKQAMEAGLIHALAGDPDAMLAQAKAFILEHPQVQQPWDMPGFKLPGGAVSHPKVAQMLSVMPAMLKQTTHGVLPAPEAIVSAMVEGAQVTFDAATRIESRYFVNLACGKVCKNMINAFWFQLNDIKSGGSRPKQVEQHKVNCVGVLGAGMMGAGIAYASAIRGIPVVLKDVDLARAEQGKAYSRKLLEKQVARGRKSPQEAERILNLITPAEHPEDLQVCDLVIEAVFEDRALKAKVTREVEQHLPADALMTSNTSTLPITGLAEASTRAAQFCGLHFFSPVDKMPLVEIIRGQQTSDETLARCYDFVLQIGKTPIVVNDSRGFFTSRVFETFVCEGMAMLAEGVHPATIENAAFLDGFPVGPLAVTDEVSLTLIDHIKRQTQADLAAEGRDYLAHPADAVVDKMLEWERRGKATGAGFYEYPADKKKHLWPGLVSQFTDLQQQPALNDVKERLLFVMALETVRCLQEQVLTSSRDANIGALFGIGYPTWTGGPVQYINQYGLAAFMARASELQEQYGERFAPPALLLQHAEQGVPL